MNPFKSKCENPQYVTATQVNGYRQVPCGQCYHCKRRTSREWQGKSLLESRFPVFMEQVSPHMVHKLDLTYADTPMTQPEPHIPGTVIVDGRVKQFAGPFHQNRYPDQRIIRPGQYVELLNRETGELEQHKILVPTWNAYPYDRPLNKAELATEQRLLHVGRYKWSSEDWQNWVDGNYDPIMTTRIVDFQRFWDRLRIWHKRNRPGEAKLRYLAATEYGEEKGRPHIHLIIWGLHPEDVTIVHDLWEDYQYGGATNGHVYPYRSDCTNNNASMVIGNAAPYAVKDVAKQRHLTTGTPHIYEQESPRIVSSKEPPIGDGAYPDWIMNHIQKGLHKAEQKIHATGGEAEVLMVIALRQLYTHVTVPLGRDKKGRPISETYPTTKRWQQKCLADLKVPDAVWDESTRRLEEVAVNEANIIRDNPEVRKLHEQYIDELRQRREEIQERQRERKAAKWSKLKAAGTVRSTG